MRVRLMLALCAAPPVYWALDAACRAAGLTLGYTGDHLRALLTVLACAALLRPHSPLPNRSQRLGKERSS